MKTLSLMLFLAMSVAISGAAQTGNVDYVLDLVTYPWSSIEETNSLGPLSSGIGGGTTGNGVRPLPIDIVLRPLGRSIYETGDDLIFEVVLENIGNETVVLPWSPDYGVFRRPEERARTGFTEGGLSLELRDSSGKRRLAWTGMIALFGSPSRAGSLQALAPGEKALVRAAGTLHLSDGEWREIQAVAPDGKLVAYGMFFITGFPITRSDDGVEFIIRDRLRR